MSPLPARTRLVQVIQGITRQLPVTRASLLGHSRFAAERGALERLANADYCWAAARSMSEAEALWLAETLLVRWQELGPVTLEPVAAILGPQVIWLPARRSAASPAITTTLSVVVDGLDAGYRVRWESDAIPEAQREQPSVELRAPSEITEISARVSVDGKCGGERRLLVDQVTLCTAIPLLSVREDKKQLLIRDQSERPAAHVSVRIAKRDYQADATGSVMLDAPAEIGADVYVEGAFAGKIPGADPSYPQSTTGRKA